ncbi:MAG: hypothetical protein JNL10_17300, partial [Verrucomicrobiales bacterium]|nr:hypothetical protein [Verrucomicrobiales bacterium]
MRELNFLETGCLAGLVLLSLILPLMLSGRLPRKECARRACFWTVGPGQALLGLA